MPNNAVTYNQIVNRFRYFAEVHQLINGNFFHVRVNEADMQKAEGSPFMIVTPTSINRENTQAILYGFEVRIMQLPKHNGDNEEYEVEVLSDTAQMVEDLLAAIKHGYIFGDNVMVRDGSSSAVDWIDKHQNVGWAVTLSIEVPKNLDACDIPGDFDFVTGGSASGGSGASIYMLKSVYDTDGDGIVDYAAQIEGIDEAGNSKYYGTNSLGVAGFYSLPSGGLPDGNYGAFTVTGGVALLNDEVVDTDQLAHRSVNNTILEHMAQNTIKGRVSAGTSDPEDLTADQASTVLDTATDPFVRWSETELDLAAMAFLGSSIKAFPLRGRIGDLTSSSTLLTQTVYYTAINIYKDMTVTGLMTWQNVNGVFTANNYNGVGLFSYSGGTLTKIAESTNDLALWTGGASVWKTIPFSAPVILSKGVYYAAALRCSTAAGTAPTVLAFGNFLTANIAFDFTNSAFLGAVGTGVTALPSSITASALTKTVNPIALFPY